MLGLEKIRNLWQPDVELYQDDDTPDIDLTAEWTRPPRIHTPQERETFEAGLKRHVERLSAIDPFRPVLEPHARVQEPQMPVAPRSVPRPMFKLSAAPTTEGTYLMRSGYLSRWSVVEVVADTDGELWAAWGSEYAWKLGTRTAEWLTPGLEGIPR
jgi:hypothetical protein